MPRIPHHRQINDWYCGPAVMQMVLGGFGVRASQAALARATATNKKRGTSRAGMVRALRAKGFRISAKHARTLAELERAGRGGKAVIVLYIEKEAEEGHYAIYRGLKRGRVLLNDPWHGPRYALPRAEFLKRWRGTAKRWPRWALTVDKKPVS